MIPIALSSFYSEHYAFTDASQISFAILGGVLEMNLEFTKIPKHFESELLCFYFPFLFGCFVLWCWRSNPGLGTC
jgi:hypothetical protein